MFEAYKYNVVIVFCFLIKDNKVLLIRRENVPCKHEYTVIGGKKERRESIAEACIREVSEETGLMVSDIKLVGIANNYKNESEIEYLTFYFKSEDFYGDMKASCEGSIEWFDIAESFNRERISEFYKFIAPLTFSNSDRIFNALIKLDEKGKIEDFKLSYI